jgi:hypothetical protein
MAHARCPSHVQIGLLRAVAHLHVGHNPVPRSGRGLHDLLYQLLPQVLMQLTFDSNFVGRTRIKITPGKSFIIKLLALSEETKMV